MRPIKATTLDRVIGIEVFVYPDKVDAEYMISSDTFYVEELADLVKLGFNESQGEYMVFKAVKKDMDTPELIRRVASKLNIPPNNIIHLGLKDKFSTSTQYLFVKKHIIRDKYRIGDVVYSDKRATVKLLGYVGRKPRGDALAGNKFKVVINGGRKYYHEIKEHMRKIIIGGVPSYYGYQRFGVKRPNTHYIGKMLLTNNYEGAYIELISGAYLYESIDSLKARLTGSFNKNVHYYEYIASIIRDPYRVWRRIDRNVLRLYIEAYQSYLFNLSLSTLIRRQGWPLIQDLCVPGIDCFDEPSLDALRLEGISIETFYRCEIMRPVGWMRNSLCKVRDVEVFMKGDDTIIAFTLDKGCFASIVLRELFKENLILP